jgi:hypothetical protein
MGVEQVSGMDPGVGDAVWCPACRSAVGQRGVQVARCEICGRTFDLVLAQQASQMWREHVELRRTLDDLNHSINDLTRRRVDVEQQLRDTKSRFTALDVQARETLAGAGPAAPGPALPAPHPQANPAPHPRTHPVPMALLLQGTGAVLVLAALVVVSAVLWGALSGGMQVGLLSAAVGLIGVLTVLTKRVVPTTSTVLAVLAAAALVVVLIAAPALVEAWESTIYLGIGGLIFTSAGMLSGKTLRVRVWWFIGVASVPVTVLLLALSALGSLPAPPDPEWGVVATSVLVAAAAAGLAWWAGAVVGSDRQTSVTAWITALISAGLVWLTATIMGAIAFVAFAFDGFAERVPYLLVLGCAGGLAAVLGPVGIQTGFWRGTAARLAAAGFAAVGLAVALLVPLNSPIMAVGVAVLVMVLMALALAGSARLPVWTLSLQTGMWIFCGLLALGLGSGALIYESVMATLEMGSQVYPAGVGSVDHQQWAWLAATVAGLGVSVVLIVAGLLRRSAWLVGGSVPNAAVSWWLCYLTGLGSPEPFEIAWLPAMAFALLAVWLGHRRGVLPRIPLLAVVLVAAVPSWLIAIADTWLNDDAMTIRSVGVVAVLAVVAAAAPRRLVAVSGVALGLALTLPWSAWVVWALPEASRLPAVVTVPTALVAIVLHAWVARPRASIESWWEVVRVPLVAALSVTVLWALFNPFPNAEVLAQVRVVLVVLGACAVAAIRWSTAPIVTMVAGWVAVVVAWVSVINAVPNLGLWSLEWHTLPSAAALGAVIALAARAEPKRRGPGAAPVSSILTFGPPLVVALLPSAVTAVGDLAGGGGIARFWLVLVASAALVVVGTVRKLAGVLVPALLAMVVVVAPVLLDVVEALPVWVPLVAVGVALLVIGARFEHVRRRGNDVAGWIAHLH